MSRKQSPEIEDANIFIRGTFNPAILHPSWLAARELIKPEEAENAEVTVVSPEITYFEVEWFSLRATTDSFVAASSDPSRYLFLRDLVIGILRYLEHTPVSQFGINRRMHYKIDSDGRYHALGDTLAPKEPWLEVLRGQREGGFPGLRSLTMEGVREGSEAQFLRVKVEPSVKVLAGIYVETNEHYDLGEDQGVEALTRILETQWESAQDYALRVALHLVGEQ